MSHFGRRRLDRIAILGGAVLLSAIVWHPLVAVAVIAYLAVSLVAAFVLGAVIAEGREPARVDLARRWGGGGRH